MSSREELSSSFDPDIYLSMSNPAMSGQLDNAATQDANGEREEPWLTGDNEARDVKQNDRGIRVTVDRSRDMLLTEFGRATLKDRYLLPGESYQDMFARVAMHYADDCDHAQRIYDYISKLWFMPATPVLSNGGTKRGLPISCFLNEANDSLSGIVDLWTENVWLAARGGGIGSYWGNLRSMGEKVGLNGKTSGVIPFVRVMDSLTLAISQGSLRRGSAAVYMPINHPEIEEFVDIRRPTGGDPNRKALNLNHGVTITDDFMKAVENDEEWKLVSPRDQTTVSTVKARTLWIKILTARLETGEPYIVYIDHVNNARPEHQRMAGLEVKTSNLCSEITLPTGIDPWGEERTAVCCLSSVNLEHFETWRQEPQFIEDCLRFLDNVLQDFIDNAPSEFERAIYAAQRERSVGLGVMGYHSFLQSKGIAWEWVTAKSWNKIMFRHIKEGADAASKKLAAEKGACPDAAAYGIDERFSNKMAIAPTASISIICGGASPGIEPIRANSFTHKTLSGSFTVKNKYLQAVLAERGADTEEIWSSISVNGGGVDHLECLTDDEKEIFKTAFEIDQRHLIDQAADRSPYICQAQSLNVFLEPDIHKRDLHQIHYQAWKKGVKSLYYCRSRALSRAEADETTKAGGSAGNKTKAIPLTGAVNGKELPMVRQELDYEECLSCQ